VKTPILSAG